MRKINALYEPEDDGLSGASAVWRSKPVIHRSEPIPESTYQTNLSADLPAPTLTPETVKYWSDYTRVFYHPKSLQQLSDFDVNDKLLPFESYDVGFDLFEKLEREIDLVDADLRPFIEECDGLQGIQIMTGIDGAWGGWTSGWLERLRDEYGKKSIWVWGLGDQGANTAYPREKRMQQLSNSARSLSVFAEQASVYVPMANAPSKSPSYIEYQANSSWHVGAMQAIALESMTISSRLRASHDGRGTLQDLEDTINSTGQRRIAKLGFSIADPDVLSEKVSTLSLEAEKTGSMEPRRYSEDDGEDDQLTSFDMDMFTLSYRAATVKSRKQEHTFGRVESARGEWTVPGVEPSRDPRDRFNDGPAVQSYNAPLLFPVLDSYPAIFNVGKGHTQKLAVHAGLTTSTAVAEQVRTVEQLMRRMHGIQEREDLCNRLQIIAEQYDEGWDSGSEGDDD
ncbi:tubulin nucleotide-binding domain-like protein [Aaosphaeria arxii CBS 175.79]|uniref:Tubulin nucleotide-binding domain-like protein n=1 Tax=Aaosphaeria arxii CBS 175.79 TaxID=1450172 RepID=A0A6A5XDX4_9PLEO|nr:tubulin nucleotide-binding domain-like protein [Aaosphaeria arxii CBS 175.79]KAF2011099.1 tubulin nucleotide-binding domain-like protein [Aaosphaeria arxii CBS 175.79]